MWPKNSQFLPILKEMKTFHQPCKVSSSWLHVHVTLGEEKGREEDENEKNAAMGGNMARDSRKREVTMGRVEIPKEMIN